MNKQSPEAYDPILQEKVDQLTKNPNEYILDYEIERQVHNLEMRRREIRAMEKECERGEITIAALRKALAILKDPSSHNKPHEGTKFKRI